MIGSELQSGTTWISFAVELPPRQEEVPRVRAPRAQLFSLVSPEGTVYVGKNIASFAHKINLSRMTLRRIYLFGTKITKGPCKGWKQGVLPGGEAAFSQIQSGTYVTITDPDEATAYFAEQQLESKR